MCVVVCVCVGAGVGVGGRRLAHCALIDIIAVFSSHQPLVARVVRHYLARGFSAIVQVRGVTPEVQAAQGCRALLAGLAGKLCGAFLFA